MRLPTMLFIKLAVLLVCCISLSHAVDAEVKPTDDKVEAVTTTKLTPSVEEAKSKTEKRDSSDQTGTVFIGSPTKETAFRAIYPAATYYEAPSETDSIFEPTTVRYTAADAAPQAFYGKSEGGNTRAGEQRQSAVRSSLPGPLRLSQHQLHQQQQQQQQLQQQHHVAAPHRFSYAVPQQVELYQRPIGKSPAAQQHSPIYNYVEAEPNMYERLAPQQYQLGTTAPAPHQVSLPGHRVQYIIAIPLSYMRQLQQQLSGNLLQAPSTTMPSSGSSTTTSSSTTTTTSTASPPSTPESAITSASHSIVQLLGPMARDHQSIYRQYYQTDGSSAAPTAASPFAAQQYLQIPASVLLAATQQLQQHHQQQQQQASPSPSPSPSPSQLPPQVQAFYSKAAPTPSSIYQPFIYQSQPHYQFPRLYPAPQMIYAEQPIGQQTTLYAYPLPQQQQQHHQQQQQQGRLVRLGPKHGPQQHKYVAATPVSIPATAATTTTATLGLPTATTATHEPLQHQQHQQPQQQQQHSLPIVHYNPIYVQAPTEQQQQQQHQFAILPRFSNNNPKAGYTLAHESVPPIHVVRLSAASALGHQQPQPIHHYHHYQAAMPQTAALHSHHPQHQHQQQQQQQQPHQHQHLYQPHALPLANYIEEQQQQQQHHQQQGPAVSPALIPYFSHPGAVHYGTHLYHPASVASASAAAAAATGILKQQQQQRQAATETTATSGRLSGDSGVKQPTAATNIVKYP